MPGSEGERGGVDAVEGAPLGVRRVRELLARLDVRPSRRLGQSFLCDPRAAAAVLDAAELAPDDVVLEVGPGLGALTYGLAAAAGSVVAVEVDARLAEALLAATRHLSAVRVVRGDALRVDLGRLLDESQARIPGPGRRKLVASPPYAIVGPLLARLLDPTLSLERLVVVVQREVAERIVARPGTKAYGLLTVLVQCHTEPRVVAHLPPAAFWPPPAVSSAVVRMLRRATAPVDVPAADLLVVAAAAFGQRRKMLLNALSASPRVLAAAGGDRAALADALSTAGIDPRRRGETLSVEEFGQVAVILFRGPPPGPESGGGGWASSGSTPGGAT